jgi:hypothetical protein
MVAKYNSSSHLSHSKLENALTGLALDKVGHPFQSGATGVLASAKIHRPSSEPLRGGRPRKPGQLDWTIG